MRDELRVPSSEASFTCGGDSVVAGLVSESIRGRFAVWVVLASSVMVGCPWRVEDWCFEVVFMGQFARS